MGAVRARRRKVVGGVLLVGGAVAVMLSAYISWIRPWQLRWGATDEEVARILPGDDFLDSPSFNATRAVTVNAAPEFSWPWLVQIGHQRAGWYSYDWIDNLGKPSADRILPDLQQLAVGDLIPISPDGKHGFTVHTLVPNEYMLWGERGEMSWLWFLERVSEKQTRLITRVRLKYRWKQPTILLYLLIDVGDLVMMRKCMLGIQRRAEALAAERAVEPQSR
jgi:hypothetical protein